MKAVGERCYSRQIKRRSHGQKFLHRNTGSLPGVRQEVMAGDHHSSDFLDGLDCLAHFLRSASSSVLQHLVKGLAVLLRRPVRLPGCHPQGAMVSLAFQSGDLDEVSNSIGSQHSVDRPVLSLLTTRRVGIARDLIRTVPSRSVASTSSSCKPSEIFDPQ